MSIGLLLLIIALCNGHLSQVFGSGWKRSVNNTPTGPVSHTCNEGEVFVVQRIEGKQVILQCSPIMICNQLMSAATSSTSGMCAGKANYVRGINQVSPNGDILTICSQFTPPVQQHVQDNCGSISTMNGNLAERPKSNNHPNGPSPGVPNTGSNGPASPSNNSGTALLEMMASSSSPPVVKGIQKIMSEYLVTYCFIQCDQTTTTSTTSTPKLYTVSNTATLASAQKPVQPNNYNQDTSGGKKVVSGGTSGHGSIGTAGNGAGHTNSGHSQPGSSENRNSAKRGIHKSGERKHESHGHPFSKTATAETAGNGIHLANSTKLQAGSSKKVNSTKPETHKSGEHKHENRGHSSEKPSHNNKLISSGDKERKVNHGKPLSGLSSGGRGASVSHNSQKTSKHSQQGQVHNSGSNSGNGGTSVSNRNDASSNTGIHHGVHHSQSNGDNNGRSGNSGNGGGSGGGGGGGFGGCFSSEMTIQTKAGVKRMDQLKVGDEVLVATSDSIECYQPVECFYHQNENVEALFVTIVTQSNVTLSLTPNHLIPFVPCLPKQISPMELMNYINYQSVFAQNAEPGLCLAKKVGKYFESDIIVSVILEKKIGVYSPITTQGTVIVNGIQSSCYSTVEHHFLQHGLHTGPREVPLVLKFAHEIAKLIVPSLIFT